MDSGFLSFLLDSVKEAVLVMDDAARITFCNDRFKKIFEECCGNCRGADFKSWLDERSGDELSRMLRLMSEIPVEDLSFTARSKSDGPKTPDYRIHLKRLDEKHRYAVIIEAGEESEGGYIMYRILAENAYDLNLIFAGEDLMYISPSVRDILGYRMEDIRGMDDWHALIHPDDRDEYLEKLNTDGQKGEILSFYTFRLRHVLGHYLWLEVKIKREAKRDGRLLNIMTAVDITKRKEAEIALVSQNIFINELFDSNPSLIYVRGKDGRMIYCNRAVMALAGKSREALLSGEVSMFPLADKADPGEYRKMEAKVMEEGKELMIEERIPDSGGKMHYYQTVKKPLKIKDGEVAVLNISTNIDKIKFYEQETVKAMEAREDFFSAMSHEIRTPLNAVIGIADLLLKRNPRKDQQKLMQTLDFSAKNLMSLINDVLDFSKIRAGKVEIEAINFNLKELLGNIKLSLSQWAANKGIEMELVMHDNLPELIRGDYVKLSQILNNLLGNAVKFTERGKVRLEVAHARPLNGKYFLSFSVTDTGIGISQEKLATIFEPFHQAATETYRKFGGTGLGLSIVKNLIDLLGGTIRVESKEGVGTTFSFDLPFYRIDKNEPIHNLPIAHIKNMKWKMKLNVLYVEDVATNQFLIEEILSDWGIRVDMVSSGEEALEKVNSCIYDMILMDIQMPGMDGFETTKRIRSKEGNYFKEVPVIAMTASTSDATRRKVIDSGMQDLVRKPISADDLRSRMIQHIKLDGQIFEDPDDRVSEESESLDPGAKVNFEQTDQLFSGNVVRYQEFLRMSVEELSDNRDILLAAILEEDLEVFRKVNHRMKNLLGTLSVNDLLEHLENIKEKLRKNQLSEKAKEEIASGLKNSIEEIIDIMSHKRASLKWL